MNRQCRSAGWLPDAEHCPSPNFNARPAPTIDLVVIHNISLPPGEFQTGCIQSFFCNELDHQAHPFFSQIRGLEVSSHFLIDRCGHLIQFVSLSDRAWHAGQSRWRGRENCNDFSIGIELEGTDTCPYTDAQYQRLTELLCELFARYPTLDPSRIVGHCDIAPERKTDPGPAFDWERLRRQIATLYDEGDPDPCD